MRQESNPGCDSGAVFMWPWLLALNHSPRPVTCGRCVVSN